MGRKLFFWIVVMFHVKLIHAEAIWRSSDGLNGKASCIQDSRQCVESGKRLIDGIEVERACWKYSYKKTCNFPSKNDCEKLGHCYEVGIKECLIWDEKGNCVNQKKEFSCKERNWGYLERQIVKQDVTGKEAAEIVCKGIPCIDGNCVDKSYEMDADILKSVSKLYGASTIGGDIGNLFAGAHEYCRKKPVGYMSCCRVKGWGAQLGASCSRDEIALQKKREQNLCIYVGKSTTGTKPFHVNKHHFCCFGNLFNKVFQSEARKQLAIDFGDGYAPDCGGLTIDEISSLDFDKMDFSEFSAEIVRKMKLPKVADLESRISASFGEVDKKTGVKE